MQDILAIGENSASALNLPQNAFVKRYHLRPKDLYERIGPNTDQQEFSGQSIFWKGLSAVRKDAAKQSVQWPSCVHSVQSEKVPQHLLAAAPVLGLEALALALAVGAVPPPFCQNLLM